MTTPKNSVATASVPLPSADLINYRFDATDKQFAELFVRLDKMSENFVTKEDFRNRTEYVDKKLSTLDELKVQSDEMSGAIALIKVVIAVLSAVATLIGGLWWVKG